MGVLETTIRYCCEKATGSNQYKGLKQKETKKEIHFQRKEVALFLNTELTNQTHFT